MKKTNNLWIVLICSIFTYCQTPKQKIKEVKKIKKIEKVEMKCVGFYQIFTYLSVDCDDFENSFPSDNYKTATISDTILINELLNKLDKIELEDSIYRNDPPDTRAKIKLISENDTSVICLGKFRVQMKNKIYKNSKELIDFIEIKTMKRSTWLD